MTAGDFFDETRSGIVPMLDHMIESGDIPPLIVVCTTFDAENQSQSFSGRWRSCPYSIMTCGKI